MPGNRFQRYTRENAQPANRFSQYAGVNQGDAFLRGLGDSLSLSFGDEIMGGLAGANALTQGGDFRSAYDRQVAQSRANLEQAAHERPWETGAGEIAGYLTPGFGVGKAVTRGASLGGRLLRSTATGAALGGASGFGAGETMDERLQGGALGAAFGGALGGGAHAVLGEAIPALARQGRRWFSGVTGYPVNPGRMGIAETAREDLMATARQNINLGVRDEGDLVSHMNRAAQRDPELTVAEVLGQSGQGRLAALARAEGETGQRVEDFFNSRARNQGDEVTAAMLGRAPASGDALEQHLIQQWETRGPELYRPALAQPMAPAAEARFRQAVAPRIDPRSPTHSPALEEAWNRAGRLIQEDVSLGRLQPSAVQNLPHRLHYTKLALDDMVKDPTSVPSGLRHVSNAQMAQIARHFAETLDPVSGTAIIPGYRAARGQLADIATARRAIETGRQAFSRQNFASVEALQRHIAQLPDAERPYFIGGVEDALSNMIRSAGRDGRRNVANSILSDQTQARLRAIYGPEAQNMIERLRTISGKFDFGQRVRPSTGSITSNILLQLSPGIAGAGLGAANAQDDPLMGALTGGALGFGLGAAGRRAFSAALVKHMERGAQRQRNLLGRIYLTPAGEFQRASGGLLSRAQREAQRRASRQRLERTRGAYLAGFGGMGAYNSQQQE